MLIEVVKFAWQLVLRKYKSVNGDCTQNMIVLIPKGLQIVSHFSYLSGKYESYGGLSCTSQSDSVIS
jgi:hypothetical protein